MRTFAALLLAALACPAGAADDPCQHAAKDPQFTACWREQFKTSEADVQQRLRVLAVRHRKDEPALHRLMTDGQQKWLAWREASCRVDTFESKGGSGFGVYWDRCRIKLNQARAAELQRMIDNP